MDKCDEEERKEVKIMPKKQQKGGGGRVKKVKAAGIECLPDPNGRRVVAEVDEDMKKKVKKLDAAKSRPPGVKGRVGPLIIHFL